MSEKEVVEAILFAVQEISEDELSKRTKIDKKRIREILKELKEEYKDRGIKLRNEGKNWKFVISQEAAKNVKEVVKPEIPKSVAETLSIIASNRPISQSEVIKIRGNKAYEHIKKLIRMGLVSSERKGRNTILDITQKFFDYFNISEEDLKKIFSTEEF